MLLAEFLIITLGASIGKALAKSLLGEGFASEVVPELVGPLEGWVKDKTTRRDAAKQLERLGQRVAERIRLLLNT